MRNLVLTLILCGFAFANNLVLQEGKIAAHTEVFGDSTINPESTQVDSKLTIDNNVESIKGLISLKSLSFISDNKDRDKHMYEVLNVVTNPTITFNLISVERQEENYKVSGFLTLNGITKKIDTTAVINQEGDNLSLDGNFSFLLTDYGMEPPTMFFLTVRDQIDIKYTLAYKKD